MSDLSALGLGSNFTPRPTGGSVEHVVTRHPLRRVLQFRNRSIDDIVNSPIVKREIAGYFKLLHQIDRDIERSELERQWDGLR